jgi:formylglycine-generating enzyme required for sulfatase activity
VVLYEMLTGRKPYSADTPAAILLKQATEPLPRPSQFAREMPEKVERLLLKVLARNPADRYANMGEFAVALESALSGNAAPARQQPVRPRERTLDTQATVNQQWEGSTQQEPLTPVRVLPSPTGRGAGGEGGLLRYWPLALIGILLVGALSIGNGLLGLGKQGIGPLAELATDTATPTSTSTSTPTKTPTKTFTPTATAFPDEITDPQGVSMRLVPAGEFTMGGSADTAYEECQKLYIGGTCDRDWYLDEEPAHTVYLDSFYMDKYEVSNAAYRECVSSGACQPPTDASSDSRSSYFGNSSYDDYPVIHVTWDMANAYCDWRGARLPTEAEWEKAARGPDGRLYPWGNAFDGNKANFCDENCSRDWSNKNYDDGYADIAPVTAYSSGASVYGIFNLAGNVWEWVADWYDSAYYANSPSSNPLGPSSGDARAVRGGSWYDYGYYLRPANRGWNDPSVTNGYRGFRCALSLP